jgi:hypothetical protein
MPHSAEPLGEVPGEPPTETTRNQLLPDVHAVNNHSITVCDYSPCLAGRLAWGRMIDNVE